MSQERPPVDVQPNDAPAVDAQEPGAPDQVTETTEPTTAEQGAPVDAAAPVDETAPPAVETTDDVPIAEAVPPAVDTTDDVPIEEAVPPAVVQEEAGTQSNVDPNAADENALLDALDDEGDGVPAAAEEAAAEVADDIPEEDDIPFVEEKNPDEDFPQVTWEELFGAIPRDQVLGNLDELGEEEPIRLEDDPEVYDSRGQLLACFGQNFANELSISEGGFYHAAEVLKTEMKKAQLEQDCDDVDACFGVSCRTNLLSRPGVKLAPLAIRTARRPKNPLRVRKDKQPQSRLLMEMPTIDPNRQILHMEPSKFHPKECRLQDSDPRNIFTPQNILRWNYLPQNDTYLSNARFVTWSDGSTTLHVGSDVYECFDNVDAALHVVTSQRSARPEFFATKPGMAATEADSSANMALDVEAVPIDRHIMVRAAANMPNSIETFIQYHSNKERARDVQSRVDIPINALPDFDVAKDKRAPKDVAPSLEEQFINQYKTQYFKNIKDKAKITITDRLNAEVEAHDALVKARADGALRQKVDEQKKQIEATKFRFGQKRPVVEQQPYYEQEEEGQQGQKEDLTEYLGKQDGEEEDEVPDQNGDVQPEEDATLAGVLQQQPAVTASQ